MIAIQCPLEYQHYFKPYTDFDVVDASLWPKGEIFPTSRETWIDLSKGYDPSNLVAKADGFILPTDADPDLNLALIAKQQTGTSKRIGIVRGSPKYINRIQLLVDQLAIPHYILRSAYAETDYDKYHYYGFCNLDELRIRPPASIHTSIPITASLLGIDLRLRERRPKSLPSFSYDIKLSPERLELAIENTIAIREALNEGRNNRLPT